MEKAGEGALRMGYNMALEVGDKTLPPVAPCSWFPQCCVSFIKLFHLSGGVKAVSLPQRSEAGSVSRGAVKDPLWLC